jgi:hypothetical protein
LNAALLDLADQSCLVAKRIGCHRGRIRGTYERLIFFSNAHDLGH